jgi:glycosyltransferase involved in cell wall biosynthesis
MKKKKLALVVSHPIQHFCPQYVSFSQNPDIEFKVFFASMLGLKKYLDPNFKQEISWDNLRLEEFQHEFLNGDAVLPSDKFIDAPGLEKALENFQPDILLIYGYFQKLQKRAYKWAHRNKVPLAYISDSELKQKRPWLKSLLKYPFLRRHFKGIDYFLSVGDSNEAFYKNYGVHERQILRMHFPIDLDYYQKAYQTRLHKRESIRQFFQISKSDIVLTVVGKLVNWKSQDHLISALKKLEDQQMFFHLFIIGSGPMEDSLKEQSKTLTKSMVHFPGFVKIGDLPDYYASTDIYIHPAAIEPHSIAVSEAIFMGCPILISSNCGSYGPTDDVQLGKNGFVYEFGNIDQLVSAIETLAREEETRKLFAAYSHQISCAFQQQSHFGIISDLVNKLNAPQK